MWLGVPVVATALRVKASAPTYFCTPGGRVGARLSLFPSGNKALKVKLTPCFYFSHAFDKQLCSEASIHTNRLKVNLITINVY